MVLRLSHAWPEKAIEVACRRDLPVNAWTLVTITYDGSGKASGVKMHDEGRGRASRIDKDTLDGQSIGSGVDRITDFVVGVDRIEIVGAEFANGLATGELDSALFTTGTGAVGTEAQFIYNAATRTLSFGGDGQGGTAAFAIATFNAGVILQADSIWVV